MVRFEEDYIFRNNRVLTTTPDIALTELVANSWDAGALNVEIYIPENEDENLISIQDDGCGMTKSEFIERWMTLNYSRERHQGNKVVFPSDFQVQKTRYAYGRNGVGRHGMLCFSNEYIVETWRDGECVRYVISVASGDEPYKIITSEVFEKEGHGTKISAYVNRNRPQIKSIREILSVRFIFDPQFSLRINGTELSLSSCEDVIRKLTVNTEDGVKLDISIVDSTKTALNSRKHGVAFWVSGRLVGNPSWTFHGHQFLDARYKIAKRYTIIVQTDDIIDDVFLDWTDFFDTVKIQHVFQEVNKIVLDFLNKEMEKHISDIKNEVINEKIDNLKSLSLAEKREVSSFIDVLAKKNPMLAPDFLNKSLDALLQIQQAKRGTELLTELSKMSPEQLDNLTELLKNWDINDVVSVIDEIDRRILVVEAIARVYEDVNTEELHTLHPLVLQAKWLFGAEFDSPMFASNKTLGTIIKGLFKESEYDLDAVANPRKRPDIVCLKSFTMRAVCTERNDSEAGEIMKPDQILIIELKRGGYEIDISEVAQAENYVHQIKKSGALHKQATIHAFVVGAKVGDVATHKKSEDGIVDVVTYGQLVQTANSKLFGLRERLEEHYNNIGDISLVERALNEPQQMKIIDFIG